MTVEHLNNPMNPTPHKQEICQSGCSSVEQHLERIIKDPVRTDNDKLNEIFRILADRERRVREEMIGTFNYHTRNTSTRDMSKRIEALRPLDTPGIDAPAGYAMGTLDGGAVYGGFWKGTPPHIHTIKGKAPARPRNPEAEARLVAIAREAKELDTPGHDDDWCQTTIGTPDHVLYPACKCCCHQSKPSPTN